MEELKWSMIAHNGMVRCLCYDKKGFLISGSADSTLKVIDLEDFSVASVLNGHFGDVLCVCYVKDEIVASGGSDKKIIVWNYLKGI